MDSGSTDGTQEICRSLGAEVFETADWPGFGPQKNRAVDRCSGDWILSLDADETVPAELKAEISHLLESPTECCTAYRMPRLSRFCGQEIMHGGWWPDYVLRLFKRGKARFSDDLVHERILPGGEVGTLHHPIRHEAIRHIEESIDKVNRYSSSGAESAVSKGKRSGLSRAIASGAWAFFRAYILRRGFLDGRRGFLLAVLSAEGSYYRYVKIWLRSSQRSI